MSDFRTARLLARPWRLDDADRYLDLYSRWEVARWLGAQPRALETLDQATARIMRWHDLYAASGADEGPVPERRWAVERLDDGLVLGTAILVRLPDGDGEWEVGWHFHPDSWGQGYATEAAAAALRWGFERGLEEVLAVVRPDNAASIALCRRLGMQARGRTTRYYQSELELFGLTRDHLPATEPPSR